MKSLPVGWLKWNADATRIKLNSLVQSFLFIDDINWIWDIKREAINDCRILVPETIAIREEFWRLCRKRYQMFSSRVTLWYLFRTLQGYLRLWSQIFNIIEDIRILAKAVRNQNFVYCNSLLISLLLGFVRKVHQYNPSAIFFYHD